MLSIVLTWGCGGPPLRFLSLLPLERRALHAHRFTTSCWKFVALWLLLLVSELHVINQVRCIHKCVVVYFGSVQVPSLLSMYQKQCGDVL